MPPGGRPRPRSRREIARSRRLLSASIALAAWAAALPAAAQVPGPAPAYTIHRTEGKIRVDGRLDEPAWEAAEPIRLDWEWRPGDNVEPPVESVCRTTYDDTALYIGCVAEDPDPDAIRAWLSDRDAGFEHDHFIFLLDPFHDRRRAFQFRVTPLGVQMDAIYSQGSEDFSWDTIWDSAGRITDAGYVVEVAIPFGSLRFPRAAGVQTWGFIFERSWPRSSRHRIASGPRDRNDSCLLCQANDLTGFGGIAPGHDVEIVPTVTAARTDSRDAPPGDEETSERDVDVGVTGEWGITPNVTLSATVNPDFSQVEADAAQLDVNRRFALFFEERRPFFLEGAEYFEVPGELVFTRTVADPIAGAKVTGKEAGNAFGAFVTRDAVNNLIFPGPRSSEETSLDQDVTGAVARWRRDVGESSTVGAFVTSREAEGYSNRVAGVDGFLRFTPRWRAEFVLSGTRTDYPADVAAEFGQDPDPFGGLGYSASTRYDSRNWEARISWDHVDTDFRADAGFRPQVGYRGGRASVQRTFWGEGGGAYDRMDVEATTRWEEDLDGFLLERETSLEAGFEGPLQTHARGWLEWGSESFDGEIFDLFQTRANFGFRPAAWIEIGTFVGLGDELDVDNARVADEVFVSPEVEMRIGRALELEVEHDFQRLSAEGSRIYTANLTEVRAIYHFSVRAFVRAILQYESVDRNPAAYAEAVDTESRELFGQLLFEYKLDPRTVVFVGYSDAREGTDAYDLTRTDRAFFLKLGYAWRP